MALSLREDEKFVIEALCATYGGTWRVGENPPDAYILVDGQESAVEISTLTQHVADKSGKIVPRLSQDSGVIRLCDELSEELKGLIPSGAYIVLHISAPLNKIRKTKAYLIYEIKEIVQRNSTTERVVEINKNSIEIRLISGDRWSSGRKVVGIVSNQNSNADIFENAQYMLNERVNKKTKKCSRVEHRPLWLALFNDYWLAGPDIYKLAMKNLCITHPFDKIFLVEGKKEKKEVHILYER